MNYVNSDTFTQSNAKIEIPGSTMFVLSMINYHPLIGLYHRFDPKVSRYDRFLVFFLQLSLLSLMSFLFLRNIDPEKEELSELS